jgi:hypothetical protein
MYKTIDEVYEARRNGEIDTEEFWCLVDAFNDAVDLDNDYAEQALEDWANEEEARERYETDSTEEAFKAKQRGEISAVEFYSLLFKKAYRELQEEKQRSALNEYQQ